MSTWTSFASTIIEPRATMQLHPNDIDCKRIERSLEKRRRYRYVNPEVCPADRGYVVRSPCCSHNVFQDGETIDIAFLSYSRLFGTWSLQYRDHPNRRWVEHSEHPNLAAALALLLLDPSHLFWP